MNHRSPTQRAQHSAPRTVTHPESTAQTNIAVESSGKPRQAFVEDFNMEHSCSNVTVSLRAFSDAQDSATSRSRFAHSLNSPSCVYLG